MLLTISLAMKQYLRDIKMFEWLKQIYIVREIYNSFLSDNLKKMEIAKVRKFVKMIEKTCLIEHFWLLFNNRIVYIVCQIELLF